ncbi:hypothetical protein V1504DRAFT_482858 [Lipomyces starkeyi]
MAQLKLPLSPDGISHEMLVHESKRRQLRAIPNDILVPFFLHSYYMNVKRDKTSSRYLREAIAAVLVLRLHLEETYGEMPFEEEQHEDVVFFYAGY